jgi:hypothetical protein
MATKPIQREEGRQCGRLDELDIPSSNPLCHSPAFIIFVYRVGGMFQRAVLSRNIVAYHLFFRPRELPMRAQSFQCS